MEMIKIERYDIVNYLICTYFLCNKKDAAVVHCASEKVLDELGIYMTSIGMPWSKDVKKGKGYYLTTEMSVTDSDDHHVFIAFKEMPDTLAEKSSEGTLLLLESKDQKMVDGMISDHATFDLSKVPLHLKNEEIRKMFIRSFLVAEEEIDIISPWMNRSVVNDTLIDLMENAIKRGVKIRIIYGLRPGSDEYNVSRSKRSDVVAQILKDRLGKYGDSIRIKRDNIHYKLVLCDEKFKLEGGYNYLSFTGDYSDENTRKEGSPFGRNVEEIRYLRKEYFDNDQV